MQPRTLVLLTTVLGIVPARPLALGEPEGRASAPQVTQRAMATATFGPRTSLQVSSQMLRFHVTDATQPAEASVTFAAAARTTAKGEVVLVVRVPFEMPGMTLTVVGGTEGAVSGIVAQGDTTVVARWVGGGRRTGHLQFQLRAAPGIASIPVAFELNAL